MHVGALQCRWLAAGPSYWLVAIKRAPQCMLNGATGPGFCPRALQHQFSVSLIHFHLYHAQMTSNLISIHFKFTKFWLQVKRRSLIVQHHPLKYFFDFLLRYLVIGLSRNLNISSHDFLGIWSILTLSMIALSSPSWKLFVLKSQPSPTSNNEKSLSLNVVLKLFLPGKSSF